MVEGTLRVCTKALDAALRVTHPLPAEVEEALVEDVLESYPREVKKVLHRGGQGKHKNEDQLSSELDEAMYGFYRRMIRTAAVGDSEEDQEDVTAYKLGCDRPSASNAAWEMHELQQEEQAIANPPSMLAMAEPEMLAMHTMLASDAAARAAPAVMPGSLDSLRSRVRPGVAQGTGSALNAGLGLALAVGLVRGVGALAHQISRLRKPKTKKARKPKPSTKTSWELPPVMGTSEGGTKSKTTAPRPRPGARKR